MNTNLALVVAIRVSSSEDLRSYAKLMGLGRPEKVLGLCLATAPWAGAGLAETTDAEVVMIINGGRE